VVGSQAGIGARGGPAQRRVDLEQARLDLRHAQRRQPRAVLVEVALRLLAAREQVFAAGAPAAGVLAPQLPVQAGFAGDVGREVAAGGGEFGAPGAGKGEVDVKEGGGHRGLRV